jgi:hypothetical protein
MFRRKLYSLLAVITLTLVVALYLAWPLQRPHFEVTQVNLQTGVEGEAHEAGKGDPASVGQGKESGGGDSIPVAAKKSSEAEPNPKAGAGAALVKGETTTACGGVITVTLRDFRPLLHIEGTATMFQMRVNNRRNGENLTTILWSNLASRAIEVDWRAEKTAQVEKPAYNTAFFLSPVSENHAQESEVYSHGSLGGRRYLTFKVGAKETEMPWDDMGTRVASGPTYPEYPYGLALELETNTGRLVSLMLVDLQAPGIVGRIKLPKDVSPNGPHFVLDPVTDSVLVFDRELRWITMVDLFPLVDQKKKPWPPPWPHPEMGPWHGNEELRLNQLPRAVNGGVKK